MTGLSPGKNIYIYLYIQLQNPLGWWPLTSAFHPVICMQSGRLSRSVHGSTSLLQPLSYPFHITLDFPPPFLRQFISPTGLYFYILPFLFCHQFWFFFILPLISKIFLTSSYSPFTVTIFLNFILFPFLHMVFYNNILPFSLSLVPFTTPYTLLAYSILL